jgi:acyl-coenzyme A synthetase/AMP-(fatty) acid ligase
LAFTGGMFLNAGLLVKAPVTKFTPTSRAGLLALPRTPSAKIQKFKLRERFAHLGSEQ